eukprot:1380443-Rhodomonas_salina.1
MGGSHRTDAQNRRPGEANGRAVKEHEANGRAVKEHETEAAKGGDTRKKHTRQQDEINVPDSEFGWRQHSLGRVLTSVPQRPGRGVPLNNGICHVVNRLSQCCDAPIFFPWTSLTPHAFAVHVNGLPRASGRRRARAFSAVAQGREPLPGVGCG